MSKVSAVEDLLFEHSLLNKILLIYEEIVFQLESRQASHKLFSIIKTLTSIIHIFIENYHEQTEEKYVFPFLIEHGVEIELVNELILQHKISRILTRRIRYYAEKSDSSKVVRYIKLFVKMYRYHENKEDIYVFRTFKDLLSGKKYKEYSKKFEQEEEEKLGENGYQYYLGIIEHIEKMLGIFNLNKITEYVINNL